MKVKEYRSEITVAFFKFRQGEISNEELIDFLKNIESRLISNFPQVKNGSLWFRFFKGDTLATDINDIQADLNKPLHSNYSNLLERLDLVVNKGELELYFS